jgi:hypothetical protein
MQQIFNAVPSAPQHSFEQVAQFGYAEPHLRFESFFLRARNTNNTAWANMDSVICRYQPCQWRSS